MTAPRRSTPNRVKKTGTRKSPSASGGPARKSSGSSSSGTSSNVRVVGRIRPLAGYEVQRGCKQVLHSLPTTTSAASASAASAASANNSPELLRVDPVHHGGEKRWFELDAVLDASSTQQEVYVRSGARRAVQDDLFRGFNCTILAYGQTGAGKTFTMGTAAAAADENDDDDGHPIRSVTESDGVIPRVCKDLFDTIDSKCDGNCVVELSYLEVYNEEICDLLTERKAGCQQQHNNLRIRETLDGQVYVSGLSSRVVTGPADVGRDMAEAGKRRVTASTKMNAASSRSHAIAVLRIRGVLEDSTKFQSKLTLVDLAGSERLKKTGADSGRRAASSVKEGININKGLFVLGQVVSALAEQRPKMKRKPPYRDSKLTRLLQDSLGGNSRTIMIACVSPADFNWEESVNTLRYAASARNIKNSATRNVIRSISPEEAAKLQRENQLLRQQVRDLQKEIEVMTTEHQLCSSDDEDSRGDDSSTVATSPTFGKKVPAATISVSETVSEEEEEDDDDDIVEVDEDGNRNKEKKTRRELLEQVRELRAALKQAKSDVRSAYRDTAVELPEARKQVALLQDQLRESKYFEQEVARMAQELQQYKDDAAAARAAADQLSLLVEKMSAGEHLKHHQDKTQQDKVAGLEQQQQQLQPLRHVENSRNLVSMCVQLFESTTLWTTIILVVAGVGVCVAAAAQANTLSYVST